MAFPGRPARFNFEGRTAPGGRRLPFTAWATLIAALGAGCDQAPQAQGPAPRNGASSPTAAEQTFTFDRQAPGSANQVPALEATGGTLGYKRGCLFLDAAGEEIGLVVPAEAAFDGRRLTGKVDTPDGRPIVREIGRLVSLSGPVVENPKDGRYSCDTKRVLIADYF